MSGRSRGHVAAAWLPLSLRDLGPGCKSFLLLGKAPSGAPGAEPERCVCPPSDVVLTPLPGFWGGRGAGVPGKAPLWLWSDPTCGHTGAPWCAWPGCRGMWDLNRGQAKLVAPCGWLCHPSVFPRACCPWECTELEPSSRCLLLLPRFAAHIKPNVFSKAFPFLVKTSALTLSVASARRYFGHRGCSAPPGAVVRSWPCRCGRIPAHPVPGSACRCQLCQPRRSTGPGSAGSLLAMDLPRFLPGKETPGNPNRLSQGEKQTALELESTSTSCQSSLSSLPSNQQGFSSNPTFPT